MFFAQNVAKRVELARKSACRLSVVPADLKAAFAASVVSSWLSSSLFLFH
jgi:hypothetical protein